VVFSGYSNPDTALSNSDSIKGSRTGATIYLALGGGNSNGAWTSKLVKQVGSYCSSGKFAEYDGIAFDVEQGDSGLASDFQKAFAKCRSKGLKVLVTVSHSAPYGISDASTLMQNFFSDKNIDYLSPQLYTYGTETSNDYTTDGGVSWSQYAEAYAHFLPSIVTGSYYSDAQSYFQEKSIKCEGFVQWSQTVTDEGSSGSSTSSTGTTRCGPNWDKANSECLNSCTADSDCSPGNYCYENLKASCASSAELAETTQTTQTTQANRSGLTPLQIGLIAGGCALFVVIVIIVVVFVVKIQRKKDWAQEYSYNLT
jgi:hypothetical protein